MTQKFSSLEKIAAQLRYDVLTMTSRAGSGHPSSCLSAVEIMTALFFGGVFHADLTKPEYANNDRLIFSKGHAAPLLYALYASAGQVTEKELLSLRAFQSPLEGHPSRAFPYTEVPTGSLGQGLSNGIGMAEYAHRHRLSYHTYVLLGDSEMSEGSNWEAMEYAASHKLSALVALIDLNDLGQSMRTLPLAKAEQLAARIKSFGWQVYVVDGHTIPQLLSVLSKAKKSLQKPVAIIARTVKGKGVSFIEGRQGWHGKALSNEELEKALKEIPYPKNRVRGKLAQPQKKSLPESTARPVPNCQYRKSTSVSTRRAAAHALVRLAPKYPELLVLDTEVGNSTHTEDFAEVYPERFLQCGIAEQNAVGMVNGLARRGALPVYATFSAFLTRAFDQLRMNQYSDTRQVYIGTHSGVSIGADGPSQMGLQDIAMFRSLEKSVVLYPSDAFAAERLVEEAMKQSGMVYIRATRPRVPILYSAGTKFIVGGSQTLRQSTNDKLTILAAGITVFEALKAADALAGRGVKVRVIDLYSVKPLDVSTLRKAAKQTKAFIVVEDHNPEGGIAEAVRSAFIQCPVPIYSLAVQKRPKSGTPEELLKYCNIDASAILRKAQTLI
ncbi:MAG: transketolase [Candidatus Nomurabacteria bacterium]|nr:MAG: transketolase [Candidatus Nomurabacteria bacterium]